MVKKKVTLPTHMQPQAALFAEIACELQGLIPSDKNYKVEYKNAFRDFCVEAYTHSLTPSGELSSNPKKGEHASHIAKQYMMSTQKIVDNISPNATPKQKARYAQRLRSVITSLVHLFFEMAGDNNYKVKGKATGRGAGVNKSEYSSFEITKKMKGDYTAMAQVMIRLYERNFFATVLTMTIWGVFSADYANTQDMLATFIPEIKPSDFNDPKRLYTKLRRPENREEFIKAIVYNVDLTKLMPKGKKVYILAKGKAKVTPETGTRILTSELTKFAAKYAGKGAKIKSGKDSDGNYYKVVMTDYNFPNDGILIDPETAETLEEQYDKINVGQKPKKFTDWDNFRKARIGKLEGHSYDELENVISEISHRKKSALPLFVGNNPRKKKVKTKRKKRA